MPSLHRESTDSLIMQQLLDMCKTHHKLICTVCTKYVYRVCYPIYRLM